MQAFSAGGGLGNCNALIKTQPVMCPCVCVCTQASFGRSSCTGLVTGGLLVVALFCRRSLNNCSNNPSHRRCRKKGFFMEHFDLSIS
eukprot:2975809-Amphidinium_carterae.1